MNPLGPHLCNKTMLDDGLVVAARIVGVIGGHGANLLILRNLAEQVEHTGLSPSWLGMNSTAWMSDVAGSSARCTLRH